MEESGNPAAVLVRDGEGGWAAAGRAARAVDEEGEYGRYRVGHVVDATSSMPRDQGPDEVNIDGVRVDAYQAVEQAPPTPTPPHCTALS